MKRPDILPADSYVDIEKLPRLVELIRELVDSVDLTPYTIDVVQNEEGLSLGWRNVIIMPYQNANDNYYIEYPELTEASKEVVKYASTMSGVDRIAINILPPANIVPLHYDNADNSDDGIIPPHYNLLVPLDNNGHSIVNEKLIKNEYGVPLIFDPQSYHGAFNSTFETRINFFAKVTNESFHY